MDIGNLSRGQAEALLASVILARSTSFVMTKIGLRELEPFNLLAVRLILAFLLLLPLSWRRLRGMSRRTLLRGMALGASFSLVMAAEVTGLKTANASTAAFLENTALVFVPLFQAVLHRALPGLPVVASTLISLCGVALLTLRDGAFSPSVGELFCLLAAMLYAGSIILTYRFSHEDDPLAIGVLHVGFMGLFSLMGSLLFEAPVLPAMPRTWAAILYLVVVCSCFGFTLQPLAQSRTTAERAGLFCALAPVGGALSGWLFLGERLSPAGLLGMALILCGMFFSNVYDKFFAKGGRA